MRFVSAIIIINLAYVCGWNNVSPTRGFDRTVLFGKVKDCDTSPSEDYNVTMHSIWQPLDHFDPSEKRRFKTWYYQNLDFLQPNGPIYITIRRDMFFNNGILLRKNYTLIFTLTKETKGAMFDYQQRYFGASMPPKSNDYSNYLNISQILADIAAFIKYLKSKPELQSSKVVLMGSGRAGNLATYMRIVYPNLVDAVIAATAPLLVKKDAKEYLEFTANLYDRYGRKDCVNDIEERFQLFEDALKNASDLDFFKKKHSICESNNFTVIEDQQSYWISQYWGYYWYAFIAYLNGIKNCGHAVVFFNSCKDYSYDTNIKTMKMFGVRHIPDDYQSCLEFGQFMTSSAMKRPFTHLAPVDLHMKVCKDVFGIDEKKMDEGIAQTNLRYGGITPNVTNVVFTNGEFAPDRLLGVQQNLSDSAPAFLVKESDENNILYIYKQESQEVIEIRNRVKFLIKKWIGL